MAVVCLTMGFQSAMPVKAASSPEMRAWVCSKCRNPVNVEVKTVRVRTEQGPKCTLREHAGTDCYITWDICVDEYWITCMTCGISSRQETGAEYKCNERHISYS